MRAAACAVLALAIAAPAEAGVLIVRAKGAQIDEAVGALRGELGDANIVGEIVVDEATLADAVSAKAGALGATTIVGVGARAAQLALKQAALPVVHCMVLQDAQALDSDRSVGVPLAVPARAQLAALKRVVPKAKRVGLLYDPKINGRFVDDAGDAARALGMTLVARAVTTSQAAPAVLDDMIDQLDALIVAPDATVVTRELVTFLVARAFAKKLPVLAFSESLAKAGALAALAPSYAQNGKLCAGLARRVMSGEKPSALRGTAQMSGSLVVNVATARRIGLDVAADVLRSPTLVVGQ